MKKLRKLTLAALLTAAGLVVFVIEAQLPPLTAIPGIKAGPEQCVYEADGFSGWGPRGRLGRCSSG